jgi:translation initiation factor 3 subunit E
MGADAKIDLEKVPSELSSFTQQSMTSLVQNVIEINRPPQPIYQTVIEKTRGLALRTQALGAAMARSGQPGAVVALAGGPAKSETQAPAIAVV